MILNKKGISIIEVLVSVSLLSLISLTIVVAINNNLIYNNTLVNKRQSTTILNNVTTYLDKYSINDFSILIENDIDNIYLINEDNCTDTLLFNQDECNILLNQKVTNRSDESIIIYLYKNNEITINKLSDIDNYSEIKNSILIDTTDGILYKYFIVHNSSKDDYNVINGVIIDE